MVAHTLPRVGLPCGPPCSPTDGGTTGRGGQRDRLPRPFPLGRAQRVSAAGSYAAHGPVRLPGHTDGSFTYGRTDARHGRLSPTRKRALWLRGRFGGVLAASG